MVLRHAELARELRVLYEMMILAVHGDEELRPHEIVHELELLLARMARDVDALVAPVDDVGAELQQVVDRLGDELLVARDRRRRDDDRIARHDADLAVIGHRHARKRRHRFALAARRDDDDPAHRIVADLVDVDDCAFRRVDVAELERNVDDIDHAAAEHGHLALIAHRRVDDLLDAMDVRRERRDDDAAAAVVERLVERRTDRALARRMALALRVRRVSHHHEHALVAELRETAEIRHLAVNRRIVELEVARMHDHAERCLDGEADRIWNRMVHTDETDAEAADIDDVALHDGMEHRGVDAVLFETSLEDAEREARAVDRNADLLEHIRQRADMIFVAVCEHDGLDLVAVLEEIRDIRNHEIDAEHILLREHETGINEQDLILIADDRHILANLSQTAERNDLQFLISLRQKITPPKTCTCLGMKYINTL